MRLEQRDKELAAIGASIGANCRPCIEYHLRAGREAGLSDRALADAVATARAVRDQAIRRLAARIDELLGSGSTGQVSGSALDAASRDQELVALGASVGANAHSLLDAHVASATRHGLTPVEVEAAVAMAEHVQRKAAEITADKAESALETLTTAGEVN